MLHLYSNLLLKPHIFEGSVLGPSDTRDGGGAPGVGSGDQKEAAGCTGSFAAAAHATASPSAEEGQIDAVFSRIRPQLYGPHDYWVVFHCLKKLQRNTGERPKVNETSGCISKAIDAYFKETNAHLRALLLKSMVV